MNKTTAAFGKMVGLFGVLIWICTSSAWGEKWTTLTGCSLISISGNDGDSFFTQCPGLQPAAPDPKVFRLYYVDTPESDDSIPERLAEQKTYWDLPDDKTVVKCGVMAKEFTAAFLQKSFTVHTQWEDAMGRTERGRTFAMVVGGGGEDLGLALVRNGLARVYGRGPNLTGLATYRSATANIWWEKLRKAEAQAKHKRLGCWAYSGSRGARLAAAEEAGVTAPAIGAAGFSGRTPVLGPVPPPSIRPGGSGTVAPASAPARSAPPATAYPLETTTPRPLPIYSLKNPGQAQPLGMLRAGFPVTVVGDEGQGRVRVRFTLSDGTREGSAMKTDLGL